jgi:hypothetical protein
VSTAIFKFNIEDEVKILIHNFPTLTTCPCCNKSNIKYSTEEVTGKIIERMYVERGWISISYLVEYKDGFGVFQQISLPENMIIELVKEKINVIH